MSVRVLITNDDGIASEGLRTLAGAAVAQGLDVVVAAPADEASGSSAALTAVQSGGRVVVERRTLDGLDAVPAYAVAAAPAFIALIAAHGAFGDPPAAVLSGINRGANVGNAILHSGTVGAVLTGRTQGRSGLAVSLASAKPTHWETAATVAVTVLRHLLGTDDPVVLNLNVPDLPVAQVRGIRHARLARFGAVQTTITEVGQGYVQLGLAAEGEPEHEPDTDLALLAAGFATVTALQPICEREDLHLSELESLSPGLRTPAGTDVRRCGGSLRGGMLVTIDDAAEDGRRQDPDRASDAHRRKQERRVQAEEGRGQDPAYDTQRPEEPGDTSTAR